MPKPKGSLTNGAAVLVRRLHPRADWWKGEDPEKVFAVTSLVENHFSAIDIPPDYRVDKDTVYTPSEWASEATTPLTVTAAIREGLTSFIQGNLRLGRLPVNRHLVSLAEVALAAPPRESKTHTLDLPLGAAGLLVLICEQPGWTAKAQMGGCIALAGQVQRLKGLPSSRTKVEALKEPYALTLTEHARSTAKVCVEHYFDHALLGPTPYTMALGKEFGILA